MIQLKLRRTNSIFGSWACEEILPNGEYFCMDDPLGLGHSIREALEDFERSFELLRGSKPNYKWS